MIRIEINNESIWLEKNTKLRLELNSTLFQSDIIPGSIVYPFNIPVRRNEAIFNHAHYIEVNRLIKSYDCSLFIGDSIHFSCKLYVKQISKLYYRCSIVINTFSPDFKNINLTGLDYDDITIGGTPHSATNVAFHAEQIVKGNIDADYTFPVIFAEFFYGEIDEDTDESEFNPDWGKDNGSGDVGRYLNNYNRSGGNFPINTHQLAYNDNVYAMLPTPYLFPVLEKLFGSQNYRIFGDFLDDTELQNLIIFNNYPIDQKHKKYFVRASQAAEQTFTFGVIDKIDFSNDSTQGNEDDDGCFDTVTYEYEIQVGGYHHFVVNIEAKITGSCPSPIFRFYIYKNNVLDDFINVGLTGSSYEDVSFSFIDHYATPGDLIDIRADFVCGASPTDGYLKNGTLTVTNTSYQNLNSFSNKLNIANHLPDIETGKFLNALRLAFGWALFYDFEQKDIQIDFAKDIVASPNILDLTGQAVPDETELEFSEDTGFLFNIDYHREIYAKDNYEYLGAYDTNDDLPIPDEVNKIALVLNTNTINIYRKDYDTDELGWFYFSDNFYDVILGDGSEEIIPELSTLAMHLGNDMLTAQTKLVGSSPAFETGVNDFPFILLFYRGLQEDDNGNDYPMASSTNLDLAGSSQGNYSLLMDGDNGLYEKFLKTWYEFLLNHEEIRKMFVCNEIQMMSIIDLFRPQRGKKTRKCRVDNINYIPKKFSFIISQRGIEQVEGILAKEGGKTL